MSKKIFRSIFLVAMAVFLACQALILGILYEYYSKEQEGQLQRELSLAVSGVEESGMEYLKELTLAEGRLTWVAEDGTVLFDSQNDASRMENHGSREEIAAAMQFGIGKSTRYSTTRMEQTLYYAERLEDGSVLRISISRFTILALVVSLMQPMLVIIGIAFVLSLVLANRLAQKIVRPLEAIDLDRPLENDTYDELAPILQRMELQHQQIQNQRLELKDRKNEFLAVTGNMREGLVLLNDRDCILSMNPAAATFFGVDQDYSGKDFITLERNRDISKLVRTAEQEGRGEMEMSRDGREYQLRASRVDADGQSSGVVILIFDITEKVFAERNRREFTANVSHELKTPLQSIMGSAELIQNGLVKADDMPRFIGRIRAEAARLVALIDDIIRLSQLDEETSLQSEELDLYALADEEVETLTLAAQSRQVSLRLVGGPVVIRGVRQLLHEVIYNLLDNAIKYNVDGGSVTVTVEASGQTAVLRVADTGIGIPREHQQRIFERFYRVDKSHSRENGGTGLGLSIVKHAIQYMNGSLDLKSESGAGTTITVTLPR